MPQPTHGISTTATIALILILFIALFPNLFHLVWTLPFSLLRPSHPTPPATDCHPTPLGQQQQPAAMGWFQKQFSLPAKARGSYLITEQVVAALPEIRGYKVGLLNLFVQHTSCALSLNENWDSDVREDMSDALDRIAPAQGPKGEALYRHESVNLA